jgi:hypothetical protein
MMKVTVRSPLYGKTHLYKCPIQEITIYEGELIESPKWYPTAVCITTGDPSFPIRIIDPERVISMDGTITDRKSEKEKINQPRVIMVDGSGGTRYTVTIDGKKSSCTCKGFSFRRTCKHITEYSKGV